MKKCSCQTIEAPEPASRIYVVCLIWVLTSLGIVSFHTCHPRHLLRYRASDTLSYLTLSCLCLIKLPSLLLWCLSFRSTQNWLTQISWFLDEVHIFWEIGNFIIWRLRQARLYKTPNRSSVCFMRLAKHNTLARLHCQTIIMLLFKINLNPVSLSRAYQRLLYNQNELQQSDWKVQKYSTGQMLFWW